MTSFQRCIRSTKAGLEVKIKCLPWEIEMLKKNDHADRWSVMSTPLMEIKVDIIDPTLPQPTFIKGSQLLFETPRHPKVLGDLVSKSQRWVFVLLLTASAHMCALFLAASHPI